MHILICIQIVSVSSDDGIMSHLEEYPPVWERYVEVLKARGSWPLQRTQFWRICFWYFEYVWGERGGKEIYRDTKKWKENR